MRDLIARLEQAEGPSRDLDTSLRNRFAPGHVDPPPYTSSLDAALTLVPEGHRYGLNSEDQWAGCWKPIRHGRAAIITHEGHHHSAALALCIAALRARMAQEGRGDG